ncbi:uncharacterized protein [Palaemon carinicauda]|uniref:uncharacterized protein n=1 Tax=Palaemon carinicauda TaxID=392227 RepID=UPI0035B5DDAC
MKFQVTLLLLALLGVQTFGDLIANGGGGGHGKGYGKGQVADYSYLAHQPLVVQKPIRIIRSPPAELGVQTFGDLYANGGKGKGKGKGGGYGHEEDYSYLNANKRVVDYQPVSIHQPVVVQKPIRIIRPPPPELVHNHDVHHVPEW